MWEHLWPDGLSEWYRRAPCSYALCGVIGGELVIVPTLTFIAAVNLVKYLSADQVIMDCDDSSCMDLVKLEEFCARECELRDGVLYHRISGDRISAIVVVYVLGNMADMISILQIAHRCGLDMVPTNFPAIGPLV